MWIFGSIFGIQELLSRNFWHRNMLELLMTLKKRRREVYFLREKYSTQNKIRAKKVTTGKNTVKTIFLRKNNFIPL
jgi:hypothetical protein